MRIAALSLLILTVCFFSEIKSQDSCCSIPRIRYALSASPAATDPELDALFTHYSTIGVNSIWLVAAMEWLCPGQTCNLSPLDKVINRATARGWTIGLQVHGTPSWIDSRGLWYGPDTQVKRDQWVNLLGQVVSRYGTQVCAYEIWNEPNIQEFWSQGPSPSNYARLLHDSYIKAKGINPNVTIVGGNLSQNDLGFWTKVYSEMDLIYGQSTAKANKYWYDVLGVHPYSGVSGQGYAPADDTHTDANTPFGPKDPDFLGYRRFRKMIFDKEGIHKDFVFGEIGYPTGGGWFNTTESNRAQYIKDAYRLAGDDGYVRYMSWYSHEQWQGFGIHGTSTETAFTVAATEARVRACCNVPTCSRAGFAQGWTMNWSVADLDRLLTECAATNAAYFRIDAAWNDVQAAGATSWSWINVDKNVNAATSKGLKVIGLLGHFPSFVNENTSDTTAWSEYVYRMGKRYIPKGVTVWEMWNEPNMAGANNWPNPNVANYTNRILKPGSNAIRKAAKELGVTVTVLTCGMANVATNASNYSPLDFLKGIYSNGGKNYFDAVNIHPYFSGDPSVSNASNEFEKSQSLYNEMVNNGDGSKKIWITEFGYPSCSGCISEATAANYIPKVFAKWNSLSWSGPLLWYSYRDAGTNVSDPEAVFGIVRNNWNPKPALQAFKNTLTGCGTSTQINPLPAEIRMPVIYPNPVKDECTLSCGDILLKKIQLTDTEGRTMYESAGNFTGTKLISLKGFAPGMYFIRLTGENVQVTKKIIIQ